MCVCVSVCPLEKGEASSLRLSAIVLPVVCDKTESRESRSAVPEHKPGSQ